ncbi:response regulator transcription factor, partial [Streptomyces misionensis]|uniref:response regulator transcription factor n=1 Tax=Streptomyces misionensis TaxID=67331 RepID=UPI00368B66B5
MPRVLLVEDDPSVREGIDLGLRRRGHEVLAVATGEAGLEAMGSFRPDLLLLDLMLPAMSGVQLCCRVRETSQLPIVMLTARGDDHDVVTGLEAGADDYVVKPVTAPVLEARIRAALRRAEPSARRGPDGDLAGLVIDRAGLT